MPGRQNVSAEKLGGSILRSVSRSFYVSVRLLPRDLREPVGLAYLLARATDTVADTTEIPSPLRTKTLRSLASAIQGEAMGESMVDLVGSVAPLQNNDSEKALIEALPECLEYLARLDAADREDIRALLAKITQGQALDIERFGDAGEARALGTGSDLHEYTYLVAGCVGEFWTRLCFRHVRNFAELEKDEMSDLGRRYGMGLQLINILRDAHSDLRAGRCYFPEEELNAVGLRPSQILREPDRFESVYQKWSKEAARGIKCGMQYVNAIRDRRVRGATALPALIGARTLALLRGAGGMALKQKIKVPRKEVRAMIASVALSLAKREGLDKMFRRLSR